MSRTNLMSPKRVVEEPVAAKVKTSVKPPAGMLTTVNAGSEVDVDANAKTSDIPARTKAGTLLPVAETTNTSVIPAKTKAGVLLPVDATPNVSVIPASAKVGALLPVAATVKVSVMPAILKVGELEPVVATVKALVAPLASVPTHARRRRFVLCCARLTSGAQTAAGGADA